MSSEPMSSDPTRSEPTRGQPMVRQRRPNGHLLRLVAVASALVPLAAWGIGVNWVQCLIIAGLGMAALAIIDLASEGDVTHWPALSDTVRGGGRREVANLSWLLTSKNQTADRAAVQRLAAIARRRLALRGIDVNDPRTAPYAASALGEPIYRTLFDPSAALPTHRELIRCVEALERLGQSNHTALLSSPAADRQDVRR